MEHSLRTDRRITLAAAAGRIVPHAFLDADRGATLVDLVSQRIESLPLLKRRDLELALDLLGSRWATLASGIHPVPFAALSAAQQDRLLHQWSSSRIGSLKTVVQAVRRLVLLVEYTTPEAQRDVGYLGAYHRRDVAFSWEGPLAGASSDTEPVSRGGERAPAPRAKPWKSARPSAGGVLRAEVLVIGSGAGGATAAARLAEAGHDVLLLEEGPALDAEDFSENEGQLFQRLYADGGLRATDDLAVSLLQGATLGGGTTVNWMVMLRTPDWVLDEWAARHGTEGMSARELTPLFDRIEQEVHATVVPDDAHSPNNRVLLEGARSLGWAAQAARINARNCVRAGFCGVGCRYGAKQSALEVFLPRAVAAGARLVTSARADRIEMIERGGRFPLKRVHAIDTSTHATFTIEAPVVILAAGAIGTPVLLQRSGMGSGAVGRYLRLHPTTSVAGVFDRTIYGAAGIPLSVVCDEHLRLDSRGYGFWIECPPMHPALTAVATPGFGESHRELMLQFPSLATLITLVRDGADIDQSNGDVRTSADGRVRIRYRLGRADAAHLTEAVVAGARVLLAAGAQEVRTLHTKPAIVRSEQDLESIRRLPVGPNDIALFSAHVNGTCRLGKNRETAGTDANGERWDAPGVFVADGSLLPTALGVNPQETIMALSTVVAERVAARRRPG